MRAASTGRRARLRRQEGVTLLEVLVASALTVVVGLAITLAYSAMRLSLSKDASRLSQIGALRGALQALANDLKQATWVSTTTPCGSGSDPSFTFTDPGGHSVTYRVSGSQLQRGVSGSSFAVITYPVTSLAICYDGSGDFPTFQVTVANAGYRLSTTIVPRLMPNGLGVTME